LIPAGGVPHIRQRQEFELNGPGSHACILSTASVISQKDYVRLQAEAIWYLLVDMIIGLRKWEIKPEMAYAKHFGTVAPTEPGRRAASVNMTKQPSKSAPGPPKACGRNARNVRIV